MTGVHRIMFHDFSGTPVLHASCLTTLKTFDFDFVCPMWRASVVTDQVDLQRRTEELEALRGLKHF